MKISYDSPRYEKNAAQSRLYKMYGFYVFNQNVIVTYTLLVM